MLSNPFVATEAFEDQDDRADSHAAEGLWQGVDVEDGVLHYAEIAPNVFHVPGVPAVVQTQPRNPDAAGAEL